MALRVFRVYAFALSFFFGGYASALKAFRVYAGTSGVWGCNLFSWGIRY